MPVAFITNDFTAVAGDEASTLPSTMSTDLITTFAILAVAIALFLSERIRADLARSSWWRRWS